MGGRWQSEPNHMSDYIMWHSPNKHGGDIEDFETVLVEIEDDNETVLEYIEDINETVFKVIEDVEASVLYAIPTWACSLLRYNIIDTMNNEHVSLFYKLTHCYL